MPGLSPSSPADAIVSCTTDAPYANAVVQLRQRLPRPYIISTAAWHVGAYGQVRTSLLLGACVGARAIGWACLVVKEIEGGFVASACV